VSFKLLDPLAGDCGRQPQITPARGDRPKVADPDKHAKRFKIRHLPIPNAMAGHDMMKLPTCC
jgi:hypothetical protein